MSDMNWVDLIIIIIFLFSAASGFIRGLVGEIISLGALVAAIVVAMLFANPIANMLMASTMLQGTLAKITQISGVDASHPVAYIAIGFSFNRFYVITH